MGHTDPSFTLQTYAQAVKHRQRLTPAERNQHDAALEWAQLGTNDAMSVDVITDAPAPGPRKNPPFPAGSPSGRYWARTSDPQLVELVLSQLS